MVIMKCLLKSHSRKSHPPPQAHFPRIPGAFLADRIIAGRYPAAAIPKYATEPSPGAKSFVITGTPPGNAAGPSVPGGNG